MGNSAAGRNVEIPVATFKIEKLLAHRTSENIVDDNDHEDEAIFADDMAFAGSREEAIIIDDSEGIESAEEDCDDWRHDEAWVRQATEQLAPAPEFAKSSATMSVQKELRSLLKEQEQAKKSRDLGWHLPREFIGDNLFQWIVELHSFDPDIPLAKDMLAKFAFCRPEMRHY